MTDKMKYIDNLELGTLVAYRVSADKIQSGKVLGMSQDEISVEDFEGRCYPVAKADIIWVKTGQRWPKEIFKALRGE